MFCHTRIVFCTVLITFIFAHSCLAEGFDEVVQPYKIYDEQTTFTGLAELKPEDDVVNAFQEIEFMNDTFFLGARGEMFTVSLDDFTELDMVTFTTKPNPDTTAFPCKTVADDAKYECQNYITVIQPVKNDNVIVCGTNGLVPLCYVCTYDLTDHLECAENDTNKFYFMGDAGLVAHEPLQDTAWLYIKKADDSEVIFTGANQDAKQDPVISRATIDADGKINLNSVIKTDKDDTDWLNNAEFVNDPIEYGDHIYFFYRETASEYINAGKIVYSRVARVCKEDAGGTQGSMFQGKWSTFQKARLNCSSQGDFPFYFNELQDISQAKHSPDIVYATFSTPQTGATGSAVCVFRLDEIQDLFENGAFKGASAPAELWLPVDGATVPIPRPGSCGTQQPVSSYQFIKKYPLMDPLVSNSRTYNSKRDYKHVSDSPLGIIEGVRIVELVVDEAVDEAVDGKMRDIFFLASDMGHVYKMYMPSVSHPVLIEEYNLELAEQEKVVNMKLKDRKLFISTTDRVVAVPVQHCVDYSPCHICVQAQDPYCSWEDSTCKAYGSGNQCLRDTRDRQPYDCNNCNDWPTPKIAFVSGNDTYVERTDVPINLYFTATAPRYSNLDYNFSCECDNKVSCTDSFDAIAKNQRLSNVEWISVAFTAENWDSNCNATVTYSATANQQTEMRTSRIEVDDSALVSNAYSDEITAYDELMAAYRYNVTAWEENAIQECYGDKVSNCSP